MRAQRVHQRDTTTGAEVGLLAGHARAEILHPVCGPALGAPGHQMAPAVLDEEAALFRGQHGVVVSAFLVSVYCGPASLGGPPTDPLSGTLSPAL